MQQTLTARRLLTSTGTIEFPVITLTQDGLIEDISSDPSIESESEDTLTPTFLDIHTHGCANHDVMEATPAAFSAINKFLATKGVGRYLPTTVTAPIDQTLKALDGIATAIESPATRGHAKPIGIHLEGPFISQARCGAHDPAALLEPDTAALNELLRAGRGAVLLAGRGRP